MKKSKWKGFCECAWTAERDKVVSVDPECRIHSSPIMHESKRKPQKVSSRGASYARALKPNDAYDYDRSFSGWVSGYRAAMRDVRSLINGQPLDVFLSNKLRNFVNSTERLK